MTKQSNNEIPYSIHHIPAEDRPRERLIRHGPESMAITELLAVIIGSGTKGKSVLQLAQELMMRFGTLQQLAEATVAELCSVKGLGMAKALQLKAAFSLGQRFARQLPSNKYRIEHPVHAYHLLKEALEYEKRELFVVILQDVKGRVICHQIVAIGTLSHTLVHPREVFHPAIRHKAASLILVHNHPSGDPTPSPEDLEVTSNLIQVGRLMGIPVNDHLIIGEQRYISMRQQGIIFNPMV